MRSLVNKEIDDKKKVMSMITYYKAVQKLTNESSKIRTHSLVIIKIWVYLEFYRNCFQPIALLQGK